MVWIKRIFFVLAIIIVVSGHFAWNRFTLYREKIEAKKYALVAAQTWIAGAKYNSEPEKYRAFRDSLLNANNLNKEEIDAYLSKYEKEPEKYYFFATLLSFYVDSLAAVEDTTLRVVHDSLGE
ncbi:MAG TPA: hypothetical protein VHP63_04865 [candidate division Zixibacteria bacterium]|nr:hypothetical protein [candidate division Zixibacteria bacterium]